MHLSVYLQDSCVKILFRDVSNIEVARNVAKITVCTIQQPPAGQQPDNYLVWSILATLFCCLPLGIVAIVKSTQVSGLWAQGQYAEARTRFEAAAEVAPAGPPRASARWAQAISLAFERRASDATNGDTLCWRRHTLATMSS